MNKLSQLFMLYSWRLQIWVSGFSSVHGRVKDMYSSCREIRESAVHLRSAARLLWIFSSTRLMWTVKKEKNCHDRIGCGLTEESGVFCSPSIPVELQSGATAHFVHNSLVYIRHEFKVECMLWWDVCQHVEMVRAVFISRHESRCWYCAGSKLSHPLSAQMSLHPQRALTL